MGTKKAKSKAKPSAKKSGGIAQKAGKVITSAIGAKLGLSASRGGGGRRRSRVTPEKLAKQILILRLKKRLYKMKYGGK